MEIPNYGRIIAKTVIFDLNGTLGVEGKVRKNIKELLRKLSEKYEIVVLSSDTFGTLKDEFNELDVKIELVKDGNEKLQKALKYEPYIGVGNGNNDVRMLENAELAICVIGEEGASVEALLASDVMVKDVKDAINLLLNEKRLIATLRG
ncbi:MULTISPECIES: HAD family hydrolase [Thermococcus]|uniref:Putative HAD family hydrolase, a n=2 Tax=Thermococcus sibiricus TaxID=172049 RepID=C6A2F1_THESM|nr:MULTISPECIES: HAD family hydrolase [Thermococcus]ACS89796.1 Putative HAD family hydrolase, a [Thermococcus sibiricus MM 739]KUK17717.1 MAG: Putative HAD family hydrolase, a [Thermococcus sibiricus]MBC7095808.1 HAD family hydrolase [Thermococcus sp.]HII68010.1 HAD family hydrolase [Thermococcaceae archaeon]